jgi:uncharacterized membrane protein YbaN (DUF454 family)
VKALDLIKIMKLNVAHIIIGVIIGIILGVAFYLMYVYIFHESSSEFYLFAGLALFGSPLAGSIITSLIVSEDRPKVILISGGAILLILIVLSILAYLVLPLFFYESVQLPASYIDHGSNSSSYIPSYLNYSIAGIGTGRLITSNNNSAVVVMSEYDRSPYASTVYLINKSSNKTLMSLNFNNDIIAAAIDQGTLNIFNDKIGYYINTENGEFVKTIVRFDNYRGLFTSDNNEYMQTTFETSFLNADWSVGSHRQMYMNCTAFGCFIIGSTGQIIE